TLTVPQDQGRSRNVPAPGRARQGKRLEAAPFKGDAASSSRRGKPYFTTSFSCFSMFFTASFADCFPASALETSTWMISEIFGYSGDTGRGIAALTPLTKFSSA